MKWYSLIEERETACVSGIVKRAPEMGGGAWWEGVQRREEYDGVEAQSQKIALRAQ